MHEKEGGEDDDLDMYIKGQGGGEEGGWEGARNWSFCRRKLSRLSNSTLYLTENFRSRTSKKQWLKQRNKCYYITVDSEIPAP